MAATFVRVCLQQSGICVHTFEWTQVRSLPEQTEHAASASAHGRIYCPEVVETFFYSTYFRM